MDLVYRGRVWKFQDNIANDQIIATRHVVQYDPRDLAKHCFESLRPDFSGLVRKGDLIVAGRNFGYGIFHIHGYLALKFLGLGILAESVSRGTFRLAVSAGLPLLPFCPGVTATVNEGEELEVDFAKGVVRNLATGNTMKFSPLPEILLRIIEEGGRNEYLRKKWQEAVMKK